MSIYLPSHYVKEYANTIDLLLQQKDSRFSAFVMTGSHSGEQASPVDQYGAIEMQEVVGRFGPIGRVDAPNDRRWVSPSDFDLPQLVDPRDELRMITDPKGKYVQNALAAANRKKDDIIVDAFFADAKTGKTGTSTTSFLAGNVVAVDEGSAGNSGLIVAKLRAGKKILLAHEVDQDEEVYMGITAEQHDDLLAQSQIISTDIVAADAAAAKLFGVDPSKIDHIRIANEMKLGSMNLDKLSIYRKIL